MKRQRSGSSIDEDLERRRNIDPTLIPIPMSVDSTPQDTTVPLPFDTKRVPTSDPDGTAKDKMQADNVKTKISFENLFCLLELISEQGSGGLVDKVIIAQDSLSKFINKLSPGAYTSMTKVDFKALDAFTVRPVGVYGSKDSVVDFLLECEIVGDLQADAMLANTATKDPESQVLPPGLYIAVPPRGKGDELYLVFWPENGTWKDDAPSPIKRNRITFMRYLTKIANQIICLFSEAEAEAFVWNDSTEEDTTMDLDDDSDAHDRMFSFEVAKTLEQDENVTLRDGFTVPLPQDMYASARDSFFEGCRDPIEPILLSGEISQAVMTVHYVPPRLRELPLPNQTMNNTKLAVQQIVDGTKIELEPHFSLTSAQVLLEIGLESHLVDFCKQQLKSIDDIEEEFNKSKTDARNKLLKELDEGMPKLENALLFGVLQRVKEVFPKCDFGPLEERFGEDTQDDETSHSVNSNPFERYARLYPKLSQDLDRAVHKLDLQTLNNKQGEFVRLKKTLILVDLFFDENQNLDLDKKPEVARLILEGGDPSQIANASKAKQGFFAQRLTNVWSYLGFDDNTANLEKSARQRASHLPDTAFLATLDNLSDCDPLVEHIARAVQLESSYLQEKVTKAVSQLKHAARHTQEQQSKAEVDKQIDQMRLARLEDWRTAFIQLFNDLQRETAVEARPENILARIIKLSEVKSISSRYSSFSSGTHYRFSGTETTQTAPYLEYRIHPLELTADHHHHLQLDPRFVPRPCINRRLASSFQLPLEHTILFAQAVASDKILVVVDEQSGNITIYLEPMSSIENAMKNRRWRKEIKQGKTGKEVVLAFDETKRTLALHAVSKAQLHIFVFDEAYLSLQAMGHPSDLGPWCDGSSVVRMCFVTGGEEVLLLDDQGRARIFSLVTQQFRPATLLLPKIPTAVYPSPDGACFVALFEDDHLCRAIAYHWTTFGSGSGIPLDIDDLDTASHFSLTSFVRRGCVHFVSLNNITWQLSSVVLDITKKATEFMFQEKFRSSQDEMASLSTRSNCLLDCHIDMWTRFPVVPAVQRRTMSTSLLQPKRLVCITSQDRSKVASYFDQSIKTFEQKTRKPTGRELASIIVESLPFSSILTDLNVRLLDIVSRFNAGGWIVDILCLIPIHLAVTRENRFVPLKDGVISVEYERSLLGADVSAVVDSISFGWYESILQSYMATMPVKVVSSMGEQSVGKSYALNHLADTSFAGSAMRTTEGVWMSITPTDDALLVALDFEGVHSIERSAQEDTLLVLFNTAVSNLVLFRNNFALSRNITGLFQSFQSSSTVFDPTANPGLFRSTLAIIIKDVVDSDKKEIVREFSLKFQKIVQEEQESNFISRLHRGQLKIIPWPVIESKQFYTLFPAIKLQLDKQPVTHGNAGNFLQTMKTLMAKLKANDWRAISQSMAGHRAHRLLFMLPNALIHGYSEVEPHPEPLKDLETDREIEFIDSPHQLFLADPDSERALRERDARLKFLCQSWGNYHLRHQWSEKDWVKALSDYLGDIVAARVQHVRVWIDKNLEGFDRTQHASITTLERSLDANVINLKANVELCKQQCSSCQLLCLLNRRHDEQEHDCLTSHKCEHSCEFMDSEVHPGISKVCGYPAGHTGKHICVVEDHLCGEPCMLRGKVGCLGECTQVAAHEDDEHRCSSRLHACGQPCKLSSSTNKNRRPLCRKTCAISSDIVHDEHLCDNRMCPVRCQICSQMCASEDHLHPLREDAVHLCGEAHPCKALCAAQGICEIDLQPQSIEATFTGRHETFQYTKYSQVMKRLPCVVWIPAGETKHSGKHSHTTDLKPFHFCEAQCLYCGYYCTLPLGHSQQDHETSHGSMSKTQWAMEDPDTVVELKGHKYGSTDEGAPMLCNLYCQDMGRHVHIDFCRADSEADCNGAELQHVRTRLNPQPDRAKDWITHELYWKRSGFKDPYSRDDKTNFAKCDSMCAGPEHAATATTAAQPSYCTLPLFHAPDTGTNNALGYTSLDGHHFSCKNPVVLQQAFHVIFVIDRSGSMGLQDRQPLPGTPVTRRLYNRHNDRLGAVYSALYAFWTSRLAASTGAQSQSNVARRDAYSVILFDDQSDICVTNDFSSSPDQLIDQLIQHESRGGTNYDLAVTIAQNVMQQHWSTERGPVIIFLSDGECTVNDQNMQALCRSAVSLGKPLSFHSVSFGETTYNATLQRMTQIAQQIESTAPRDPLLPLTAHVASSFATALDTVRLAETFLGLADSLKKPRGALFV